MDKILLCTDLDRTLLPNGQEPESDGARPMFARLAAHPQITLVYVTGRNRELIREAIRKWDIPVPDFAVGDVGTTIYRPRLGWQALPEWTKKISAAWNGRTAQDLQPILADLAVDIRLQEPEKQGLFKLSFYADTDADYKSIEHLLEQRLSKENIFTDIVWSIDPQKSIGLLDILPRQSAKHHAVYYLKDALGFSGAQVIFCGDSGNDLKALTSGLQAVIVANADRAVRDQASLILMEKGLKHKLYNARGGFMGMNGNYCAGVLEGLAHFRPETVEWMAAAP